MQIDMTITKIERGGYVFSFENVKTRKTLPDWTLTSRVQCPELLTASRSGLQLATKLGLDVRQVIYPLKKAPEGE